MNKAELIEDMSKVSKLSRVHCKAALEAFITCVGNALKKNDSVALAGFGTFVVMKRSSRDGINPATGKPMKIPAKNVPKFKPGKVLKSLVG